jgi:hypothetical protein
MIAFSTTIRALAVLAAVSAFPVTAASAQEDGASAKVLLTTTCGPAVRSIIRTEDAPSTTNAVAFVNVPGATGGFTVAAGTSRCIKLLFTAETVCRPSAAADFCYVRALINGVPMLPDGANFQTFDSEDGTASAHAYEWVRRVRAGNYTIVLQRRVGNAATFFTLDDWTFDLQLLQ